MSLEAPYLDKDGSNTCMLLALGCWV